MKYKPTPEHFRVFRDENRGCAYPDPRRETSPLLPIDLLLNNPRPL